MKTKRPFRLAIFYLAVSLIVLNDSNATAQSLKIGDNIPNIVVNKILNYQSENLELKRLNGKVIIIDFWATWCSPCIEAMSHLDSIQSKFGDQIQILTVTQEKRSVVQKFLTTKSGQSIKRLPIIVEDTMLNKFFTHRMIPHTVIVKMGKVDIITSASELSLARISHYLEGKETHFSQKQDIMDFDPKKPLLWGGIGDGQTINPSKLTFSSTLTKYIDGLSGKIMGPQIIGTGAKIAAHTGVSLIYRTAFTSKFPPNIYDKNPDYLMEIQYARTKWEARDSTLFYGPGVNKEKRKLVPKEDRAFFYELVVPKADSAKLNFYMISDLNRYFGSLYGIEGVIEERTEKCWVLQTIAKEPQKDLVINDFSPGTLRFDVNQKRMTAKDVTISSFLFHWIISNQEMNPTPIIDETNYKGLVSFDITADPKEQDINVLSEKLKPFGLCFKKVERTIPFIIIRDKRPFELNMLNNY